MLTLNTNPGGEVSILWIAISSVVFFVFVFREVYQKQVLNNRPKDNDLKRIPLRDSELRTLKKISTRPFLFGLENKFVSADEFYFDDTNFYAISKDSKKAIFKLTDIIELGKSSIKIGNRRIWQVKIKDVNDKEVTFNFAHNYSVWNKNFPLFHQKLKNINPAVVKTKWSLWSM